MMIQQEFGDWLTRTFSNLPRSSDPFFQHLWGEGLLRFNQPGQTPDALDEWSARLVCAALEQRERLLIILPDQQPRRPALLLATGLIMCALDYLRAVDKVKFAQAAAKEEGASPLSVPVCQVLYFGSTVGIREHLGQTEVQGRMRLNLADVFPQATTVRGQPAQLRVVGRRRRRATVETPEVRLPRVLCVYAPADPVAILQQHPADWIAIDCGDEAELRWLRPLLQHAATQEIPIIAWGQNPLSECVADFAQVGHVFRWTVPPSLPVPTATQFETNPEQAFYPGVATRIQPVVLEGDGVNDLAASLREAGRVLARAARRSPGPLGQEALRLHWGYLRSLETLSVPCNLHEAEAPRLWGLKSFAQWQTVCERFQTACLPTYADLAADLEETNIHLEVAWNRLRAADPPLWDALATLCAEEVPAGEARLIVFPSAARRQLFALALLARRNLSEDDLHACRIWLLCLAELRRAVRWRDLPSEGNQEVAPVQIDSSLRWHPLLVGLPSPFVTPKLLPVLVHEAVDVLLYPHQTAALTRRAEEWASALSPDILGMALVLSQLTETPAPEEWPEMPSRLHVDVSAEWLAETRHVTTGVEVGPFWQLEDPVDEVTRLLQADDETVEDDITAVTTSSELVEPTDTEGLSLWCEDAIEVHFDQGWHACFAPDETINMIVTSPGGQQADERYVRSLRPGDRVVVIHGQRRQNLYGLIISRVHRHPSIELHLALIRRWQEDFKVAYQRWRQHGVRNLEELLRQMREHGSALISPLTLSQWLRGQTLCPQDEEDLRRLAEVLDLGFVRQYYRRIHLAASRLSGLHRGLANRLNHWLEQQAAGLTTGSDDDVIDPELGLTFGDFRNSLLILRVVAVQSVAGPFMRSSLGRLERDTNDEQSTVD